MASPEPAALPVALDAAVDAFRHHIEAERGLSRHTVRAYLGDVAALLEHAAAAGATGPADLGVATLRSWLAEQHGRGQSRATLARRAAAARAFTAFAHARGLMPSDPGPLLGMPRIPPASRGAHAGPGGRGTGGVSNRPIRPGPGSR